MAMTPTYTLEFLRRDGCPTGIVEDMARFDAADIIAGTIVENGDEFDLPFVGNSCHPIKPDTHFREVTFRPKNRNYLTPTMARWASFAVGARLKANWGSPSRLSRMPTDNLDTQES